MSHYLCRMLIAAFKAFADLASADFRAVFAKAVGLALGLFVALLVSVEAIFWFVSFVPWPWVETVLAVLTGVGLVVLFFFLMAPVTSLFAGFYLDSVAAKVEAKHYPTERPGVALSGLRSIGVALQFGLLVLAANILALPLVGLGIGIVVLVAVNAYLISREYFELAAMRYMSPLEARALRRANAFRIFVAGLLPAGLALVPIVNLVVPLFSTSYFVHLFKQVQRSLA
jgi:CysZ protein